MKKLMNTYLNKEFNIEDKTINQLNELTKEMIKKKLPSEFLEEMMKKYLSTNRYKNIFPNSSIKILKKWEVISIVLDFFKSIDEDLYKRVFNIVMNNDSKIRFNIYDSSKAINSCEKDFEFKNFKQYELKPYNVKIENRDIIYIPLKGGQKRSYRIKKRYGNIRRCIYNDT